MKRSQILCVVVAGLSLMRAASAATMDHAPWDGLLKRYVKTGLVNYLGIQAERDVLDAYVSRVGAVDITELPTREARMAFWINAYNACVFKGVLDRYPLTSVKEVSGFFDGIRYHVAGRDLTLNEIEQEARAFGDWRVHFAVVCASSSCPPLRPEAYDPARLDAQLTEQTTQFLRDMQRGLRVEGQTLWLSKIFDWYAGDFVPSASLGLWHHHVTSASLVSTIGPYLGVAVAEILRTQPLQVKFSNYDWSLNEQR